MVSNVPVAVRAACACISIVLLAHPAAGQEAPAPATAPATPPATPTARAPRRRPPIRQTIDRHVEQVLRAHEIPCERAKREGVPCFPVDVEREGPRFSVAEALRRYRSDGGPAPGVPTNAELQQQFSGAPRSASGGVSTDPVCGVKLLLRWLGGKPTSFFLYRITDAHGEQRPLLTDRRIDPAARPEYQYEFLGEFKGECQAVAAWRQALREDVAPADYDYTALPKTERPADDAGAPPP